VKIFISSPGEKTIRLSIPTRLIFNSLTAAISAGLLRKKVNADLPISGTYIRRFVKELHRIKKIHPDLIIVDIESANGEIVKIGL